MEPVSEQPLLPLSQRRKSVFMEVGLVDEEQFIRERRQQPTPTPTLDPAPSPKSKRPSRPTQKVRFRSRHDILEEPKEAEEQESDHEDLSSEIASEDLEEEESSPTMMLSTNPQINPYSRLYRLGIFTLVLAIMLPLMQNNVITGMTQNAFGVSGGVIPTRATEGVEGGLIRRDDPTNYCTRWSHQAAVVNGTLYIYGGRATTDPQQSNNEWNNDFLSIDLTKSWQISSPSQSGFPQPSGPPAVANGYLWNSHDSLYLYGGEFSEDPVATPVPYSMWEYNIASKSWIEHSNPQTSAGQNATGDGQAVQRAAEGAGYSVANLGRGWYFGGHQDYLTTAGWSNQIARIYLKSLVEFTFPGYSNNGVTSLGDGKTAGSDGTWRNITEGGLQDTSGFTERADGLLTYIPGFGKQGILLGLAGGTNATFTQMNVIDVYDIDTSTWYKQPTSGKTPDYRVNPCAVVGAAPDGSSYNVYMYGGQNLLPYGNQTQYDDMWILSVPSFTWIYVDTTKQATPPARAGHSCTVWDGQMVVVGGYVGANLSCDFPGVYVFNMSGLEWGTQFTALTGDNALQQWNGKADSAANPLAQQANQRGFNASAGLEGSYGYEVPAAVISVIGGKPTGGATVTAPVQTPTSGPLATGKPITYTVTGPGGATYTTTSIPSPGGDGHHGPNIGAIIAGVIAGVFFIIAAYFAFCAWVYRKRVQLYKNHLAMAHQQANREKDGALGPGATSSSGKNSSERRPINELIASTTNNSGTGSSSAPGTAHGQQAAAALFGGRESHERKSSDASNGSVDDLLSGQEPTFWGSRGVLLNPRRSLRVINRD